MSHPPPSPDYRALADFRYQIRLFLAYSERAARAAGLEPQQHQLMLALKGFPGGARPRIADLAERLQIAHHSTVELADRLSAAGYIRRARHVADRREVLLELTPKGERILHELSLHHAEELRCRGPALVAALERAIRSTEKGSAAPAKNPARRRQPSRRSGRVQ